MEIVPGISCGDRAPEANPGLLGIALKYATDKPQHGYIPHYEKLLGYLRNQELTLLEMGVASGGSLRMWRDWLPKARIIGMDCRMTAAENARDFPIFLGDQGNPADLAKLIQEVPAFDIIIDDAGHQPSMQLIAWRHLWPQVNPGGWYVIEDLNIDALEEPSVLQEVSTPAELKRMMRGVSNVTELHVFGHGHGDGILFLRKR